MKRRVICNICGYSLSDNGLKDLELYFQITDIESEHVKTTCNYCLKREMKECVKQQIPWGSYGTVWCHCCDKVIKHKGKTIKIHYNCEICDYFSCYDCSDHLNWENVILCNLCKQKEEETESSITFEYSESNSGDYFI